MCMLLLVVASHKKIYNFTIVILRNFFVRKAVSTDTLTSHLLYHTIMDFRSNSPLYDWEVKMSCDIMILVARDAKQSCVNSISFPCHVVCDVRTATV